VLLEPGSVVSMNFDRGRWGQEPPRKVALQAHASLREQGSNGQHERIVTHPAGYLLHVDLDGAYCTYR